MVFRHSGFGFLSDFGSRHSDFWLRITFVIRDADTPHLTPGTYQWI
jgi:hypothetical protein